MATLTEITPGNMNFDPTRLLPMALIFSFPAP